MADDNQQHDFEGSKRLLESEHPSLVDRYYQSRYLIGKYFYFHRRYASRLKLQNLKNEKG